MQTCDLIRYFDLAKKSHGQYQKGQVRGLTSEDKKNIKSTGSDAFCGPVKKSIYGKFQTR